MRRFFCVMLFVVCLMTFGACSSEGSESISFFEKFYNEYLMKFWSDYINGCAALGQNFVNVPVIGPVLDFLVSVVAYAIGGVVFFFKVVLSFILFFISETAFFVEEIVKGITGTILDLIS